MLILVVLASILIAAVTVYQYREEAEDYHHDRLERKQQNIKKHINYVLNDASYPIQTKYIPLIFKDLQHDRIKHSGNFMRIFNEGATFILFAVVFLVILKNAVSWIYGTIGIIVFALLLLLGLKLYKRIRER